MSIKNITIYYCTEQDFWLEGVIRTAMSKIYNDWQK